MAGQALPSNVAINPISLATRLARCGWSSSWICESSVASNVPVSIVLVAKYLTNTERWRVLSKSSVLFPQQHVLHLRISALQYLSRIREFVPTTDLVVSEWFESIWPFFPIHLLKCTRRDESNKCHTHHMLSSDHVMTPKGKDLRALFPMTKQ